MKINNLTKKVVCNISVLRKISSALTLDNRLTYTVYRAIIEPHFKYCSLVWDSIGDTLSKNLRPYKIELLALLQDYRIQCDQLEFLNYWVGRRWLKYVCNIRLQKTSCQLRYLDPLHYDVQDRSSSCPTVHDRHV